VYSQTIAGQEAPTSGEAKNSWLTGTAAWTFVNVSQYLLGVRPELDGLRIEPCLPERFDKVKIKRVFRDATYDIFIIRGDNKGIWVNDSKIEGTVVPTAKPGTTVKVHCVV
jgi:cellobiose phosphorylase